MSCSTSWISARAGATFAVLVALTAAPRAAASKAPEHQFRLVFDQQLRSYREVEVTRGQRIWQRLPLDLATPMASYRSELADFDGDGHADLVVLPRRAKLHDIWHVFRFDPRTLRFHDRPEVYGLRARGPANSPAKGLHIEALLGDEDGVFGGEPVPEARRLPMVIRRGDEIVQVIPFDSYYELLERQHPLASADIDFDGQPDLAVSAAGNGNEWLLFWRFDRSLGKFVFWPELSELPGPAFSRQDRTIRTRENRGVAGRVHREALYHLRDGKLELTWEVEQQEFFGERPPQWPQDLLVSWLIRRRIQGQLRLVCSAVVDDGGGTRRPRILAVFAGDRTECHR